MKNTLLLIGKYFRVNLSSALEYRASFVMQAFGMALNNLTFVFFWFIAFEKLGGDIGGYAFADVMFIWGTMSSAFGLALIVFGGARDLTNLIVSGELDTFLLQPKDVLLSCICSRTSLSAWGDFAYGFALIAFTQGGSGGAWLFFLLAVPVGALLVTAVMISAHALTFYLGQASIIGGMALDFVINFCIYPAGIYHQGVRVLMMTLLPAGFIVHIPLQMARGFTPLTFALWLGGSALYCVLSWVLFYRGLKKYESGNLIVTRM